MPVRIKSTSAECERKDTELVEFKTGEGLGPGEFVGYAAVFGNVDRDKDIIQPNAFDRTFREMKSAGTYPALLWQHKIDEPIGEWLDMQVDQKGLRAHGKLWLGENIVNAERAYKMLKSKNRKGGLSIGYETKKSTRDNKGVRSLLDVELHETSVVTIGCNPLALVESIKSIGEFASVREAERHLRDVGMSATEAKSFISKLSILLDGHRDDGVTVSQTELDTFRELSASLRQLNNTLKG